MSGMSGKRMHDPVLLPEYRIRLGSLANRLGESRCRLPREEASIPPRVNQLGAGKKALMPELHSRTGAFLRGSTGLNRVAPMPKEAS